MPLQVTLSAPPATEVDGLTFKIVLPAAVVVPVTVAAVTANDIDALASGLSAVLPALLPHTVIW